MKKNVALFLLALFTLLINQNTQADEDIPGDNDEFWQCVITVSEYTLIAFGEELACAFAFINPNPTTVTACLTAVGATTAKAGQVYLDCKYLLDDDSTGEPSSPILIDLDRNQFHLSGGPAVFDIDGDGLLEILTWVGEDTRDGFLYRDRNGNGIVDTGAEFFGNNSILLTGQPAVHGYDALAEFDLVENGGNQDGQIDSLDTAFFEFRVWVDDNADGKCEVHETMSLQEAEVVSLSLDYVESPRIDQFGNAFRLVGSGVIDKNGPEQMKTTDVYFQILAE